VGLIGIFKSGQKNSKPLYPKELKRYARRNARVIPKKEHGIDVHAISRNALRVIRTLQQNGQCAYLVGGCVRDLLIGRRPKDFDVVTDATPQRIKEVFRFARIIGRRFRIVHIPFGTEIIETATFRALPVNGASEEMLQRDNIYGNEREDAFRRDITINALFYDPMKETIIDYVDGYADIKNRVVRMVRDPRQSYTEDPVRMIRALKYQATTGFRIEKSGYDPIKKMAGLITACSSARVMEETFKILRSGASCAIIHSLYQAGILIHLVPAVTDTLPKNADFAESSLAHRLTALDRLIGEGRSYSNAALLAVLLADIVSRHNPVEASAIMESVSRHMNFSRQNKDMVLRILSSQHKFTNPPPPSPKKPSARPALASLCRKDWFHDALDFFELACLVHNLEMENARAWRALANSLPNAASRRGGVRIRRKGEGQPNASWNQKPSHGAQSGEDGQHPLRNRGPHADRPAATEERHNDEGFPVEKLPSQKRRRRRGGRNAQGMQRRAHIPST
jgi:poly(A) polymerase